MKLDLYVYTKTGGWGHLGKTEATLSYIFIGENAFELPRNLQYIQLLFKCI